MSKTSNWAKAPQSAAFVKQMREVFGEEVKVIYVKEGELLLGEPTDTDRQVPELRDDSKREVA